MNQNSLNWGIRITVVWLAVIFLFWFFCDLKNPTSLNELGDFLAGIVAPIAFLWLILGYVQQGKQLEQNTKALEQQERALQLQIQEMKESVEYQKQLGEIQKIQLQEVQKTLEPRFLILSSRVRTVFSNKEMTINCYANLYLIIENLGEDAFDFKIQSGEKNAVIAKENKFLASEVKHIKFELDQTKLDELNKHKEVDADFIIEYQSKNGRDYKKLLKTYIYQSKHPFYELESNMINK